MLPTLDALDVNSPYSSNGYVPDWKYMKDRVAELENYLIASGLNDYELTEEDKSVLAAKLVDGGGTITKLDIYRWLLERGEKV